MFWKMFAPQKTPGNKAKTLNDTKHISAGQSYWGVPQDFSRRKRAARETLKICLVAIAQANNDEFDAVPIGGKIPGCIERYLKASARAQRVHLALGRLVKVSCKRDLSNYINDQADHFERCRQECRQGHVAKWFPTKSKTAPLLVAASDGTLAGGKQDEARNIRSFV